MEISLGRCASLSVMRCTAATAKRLKLPPSASLQGPPVAATAPGNEPALPAQGAAPLPTAARGGGQQQQQLEQLGGERHEQLHDDQLELPSPDLPFAECWAADKASLRCFGGLLSCAVQLREQVREAGGGDGRSGVDVLGQLLRHLHAALVPSGDSRDGRIAVLGGALGGAVDAENGNGRAGAPTASAGAPAVGPAAPGVAALLVPDPQRSMGAPEAAALAAALCGLCRMTGDAQVGGVR